MGVFKFLTEVNEKASVALALVLWKNHDARHVVLLLTVLLLEKRERREHEEKTPHHGIDTTEQVCVGAQRGCRRGCARSLTAAFLAARWNVNGITCDCKLHRGATELTVIMFIWYTTFACFAEIHPGENTPTSIGVMSVIFFSPLMFLLLV